MENLAIRNFLVNVLGLNIKSDEYEEIRDAFSQYSQLKTYNKKDVVFVEGGVASAFYYVIDGQVKVYKTSGDGKEIAMDLVERGGFVGLVALEHSMDTTPEDCHAVKHTANLDKQNDEKDKVKTNEVTYPAGCVALTGNTVLLRVEASLISYICKVPDIAYSVIKGIIFKNRVLTQRIYSLEAETAVERLLHFLYRQPYKEVDINGLAMRKVELKIANYELASQLYIAPEVLSRIMKDLTERGVLQKDGNSLLLNP